MRSVADHSRARTIERVLGMTVSERIALALSLGDDDLSLLTRASGLAPREALARLRASRAQGRRPSAASDTGAR